MSFQDDIRSSAIAQGPCLKCGWIHMGFCPIPGPDSDPQTTPQPPEVVLALGLLAEALNPPAEVWYVCRLRCGDLVAFCRAVLAGEWIELLGAVVTAAPHDHRNATGDPELAILRPMSSTNPELMRVINTMRHQGFRSSLYVALREITWVAKQAEDKADGQG